MSVLGGVPYIYIYIYSIKYCISNVYNSWCVVNSWGQGPQVSSQHLDAGGPNIRSKPGACDDRADAIDCSIACQGARQKTSKKTVNIEGEDGRMRVT